MSTSWSQPPKGGWVLTVAAQGETSLISEVLTAQRVWCWLTKPQRAAVLAATNGRVKAHPATVRALERHGLLADGRLTTAGRVVAKWNGKRP